MWVCPDTPLPPLDILSRLLGYGLPDPVDGLDVNHERGVIPVPLAQIGVLHVEIHSPESGAQTVRLYRFLLRFQLGEVDGLVQQEAVTLLVVYQAIAGSISVNDYAYVQREIDAPARPVVVLDSRLRVLAVGEPALYGFIIEDEHQDALELFCVYLVVLEQEIIVQIERLSAVPRDEIVVCAADRRELAMDAEFPSEPLLCGSQHRETETSGHLQIGLRDKTIHGESSPFCPRPPIPLCSGKSLHYSMIAVYVKPDYGITSDT